mmetsp:Transcript_44883/g.105089  ORF Transcript_44883/g.105089 Transcript_44883/m.105089 type:complete len:95 (-) Transcript_44883:153-437(-)
MEGEGQGAGVGMKWKMDSSSPSGGGQGAGGGMKRKIYVDPQHPTVFAIGMDLRNRHPQCDVLFRAPDVGSRDKWLRAIADAVTRSSVELAELGD